MPRRMRPSQVFACCVCGTPRRFYHCEIIRRPNDNRFCSRKCKGAFMFKHGQSGGGKDRTRLYRIWESMKKRCYNKNNPSYKWYGERGVGVCAAWKNDFASFAKWATQNGYDAANKRLSIDRIDNNKGYSPKNCRWVPLEDQPRNRRGYKAWWLEFNGVTKSSQEWSARLGGNKELVSLRIRRGWSVPEAITIPIGERRN